MSFVLKSVGNIFPVQLHLKLRSGSFFLLITLGLVGCGLGPKKDQAEPSQQLQASTGEVSLVGDQKTIEELRKNIPEPKRSDNDLLREILSMMGEVKHPPSKVRSDFQRTIRKMREDFRREERKTRDHFNKEERRSKEAFLKSLESERKQFKKKKVDREQSKDFYADQDLRRRDFFAEQRDKRRQFESDAKQKSSDFAAMIRERTRDFDLEYRDYVKRYEEEVKRQRQSPSTRGYEPLRSGE